MSTTAEQWITWAIEWVHASAGILDVERYNTGEDLEMQPLPDSDIIEGDPVYWLGYYAGWMGFYNTGCYLWRSVFERLERKRNIEYSGYMLASGKASSRKSEHEARIHTEGIDEATSIANTKWRRYYTLWSEAEAYRDAVSRAVTVRESDRRVTKHL